MIFAEAVMTTSKALALPKPHLTLSVPHKNESMVKVLWLVFFYNLYMSFQHIMAHKVFKSTLSPRYALCKDFCRSYLDESQLNAT